MSEQLERQHRDDWFSCSPDHNPVSTSVYMFSHLRMAAEWVHLHAATDLLAM
jgi:hypothetical protein